MIGDNVRLGVGEKVIRNVQLADNITVAAGAVVIHLCRFPMRYWLEFLQSI